MSRRCGATAHDAAGQRHRSMLSALSRPVRLCLLCAVSSGVPLSHMLQCLNYVNLGYPLCIFAGSWMSIPTSTGLYVPYGMMQMIKTSNVGQRQATRNTVHPVYMQKVSWKSSLWTQGMPLVAMSTTSCLFGPSPGTLRFRTVHRCGLCTFEVSMRLHEL